MIQNRPQNWSKSDPKSTPKWSQNPSKSQLGALLAPRRLLGPYRDPFRTPKMAPKAPQEAPTSRQRAPKNVPKRVPKSARNHVEKTTLFSLIFDVVQRAKNGPKPLYFLGFEHFHAYGKMQKNYPNLAPKTSLKGTKIRLKTCSISS